MVVPLNAVESRALPASMPAFPRIDGYEIFSEIGFGGQGKVYEARQASTSRIVALKVLWGGSFPSEDHRRRFAAEIMHASILSHRSVATVYDAGHANGYDFIAYERVHGMDLENHPELYEASHADIVRMMIKVCEGVAYIHRNGIIHRDLKPAHIIINEDGEPKIIDLGSSLNLASEVRITQTGDFVGTIAFAAPEQLLPSPDCPVDTRCDIYALGLMLYQLLTDEYAYGCAQGDKSAVFTAAISRAPLPMRRHRTPRDLETIVFKCLQKDPDRRYQTTVELIRDLRAFLRSEPIAARRDSLLYRTGMLIRRRWPILSVLTIALTLIVVSWFQTMQYAAASTQERDTHILRLKFAHETEADLRAMLRELLPEANEYRRLVQLSPEAAALSRLHLPVEDNPDALFQSVGELFLPPPFERPFTAEQRAALAGVVDDVLANRFEIPLAADFEGEDETPGDIGVIACVLYLDAEYYFEKGQDKEAFLRLRAARAIALDLANTTNMGLVRKAAFMRHKILMILDDALQDPNQPAIRRALAASFIEDESPFPDLKYMFRIERNRILRQIQWASFGGEGNEPAYVDSEKLLQECKNPIKVDYVITVAEARAIVEDYFDMYERLTTEAPDDAVAQYDRYFDDQADRLGWPVIRGLLPTGSASVRAAIEYPELLESLRQSL